MKAGTLGIFIMTLTMSTLALQAGCAGNPPPNLTPQAVRAWHGTRLIKDLDIVRDAATAAHETTPPLLSAKDTLSVVEWHQAAIVIVHDAKDGWKAALRSSVGELRKKLPPDAWSAIAPYAQLVLTLLDQQARAELVLMLEAA